MMQLESSYLRSTARFPACANISTVHRPEPHSHTYTCEYGQAQSLVADRQENGPATDQHRTRYLYKCYVQHARVPHHAPEAFHGSGNLPDVRRCHGNVSQLFRPVGGEYGYLRVVKPHKRSQHSVFSLPISFWLFAIERNRKRSLCSRPTTRAKEALVFGLISWQSFHLVLHRIALLVSWHYSFPLCYILLCCLDGSFIYTYCWLSM